MWPFSYDIIVEQVPKATKLQLSNGKQPAESPNTRNDAGVQSINYTFVLNMDAC